MIVKEHFDVLIVGAGISGISAAYHLQENCPGRTYAILERRESIGGTWDLFRYPGIRSDSDMYTLGFSFRPWTNPKAIADGPSILEYVRSTAAHISCCGTRSSKPSSRRATAPVVESRLTTSTVIDAIVEDGSSSGLQLSDN